MRQIKAAAVGVLLGVAVARAAVRRIGARMLQSQPNKECVIAGASVVTRQAQQSSLEHTKAQQYAGTRA